MESVKCEKISGTTTSGMPEMGLVEENQRLIWKGQQPERRVVMFKDIQRLEAVCVREKMLVENEIDLLMRDYSDAASIPDPVLFENDEGRLRLADGFHRIAAMERMGIQKSSCLVYRGGIVEASEYARCANKIHGMRMNKQDRHRALEKMLQNPETQNMTNTALAKEFRVNEKTIRSDLQALEARGIYRSDIRVDQNGRTVNTSNIGQSFSEDDLFEDDEDVIEIFGSGMEASQDEGHENLMRSLAACMKREVEEYETSKLKMEDVKEVYDLEIACTKLRMSFEALNGIEGYCWDSTAQEGVEDEDDSNM